MRYHFAVGLIFACVTMFTATQLAAQSTVQPSTDRRTASDNAFTLPDFRATQGQCLRLCLEDNSCRVWTFVRNSPPQSANCWLGFERVPAKVDGCCTSGMVR
jgi:hypothetical protein